MNRRILALVEGQTEFSVLSNTVAAHLGARNIGFYPKIVGRSGHKGHSNRLSFDSIIKELLNLYKQEPHAVVTTFFDFYAMPEDWPGVAKAKTLKSNNCSIKDIANTVERAWEERLQKSTAGLRHKACFVPYVQMHELEALLFASPRTMAEVFLKVGLEAKFSKIVEDCGGCEEINDQPHSAPSKRIQTLFPSYKKGRSDLAHAPNIVGRIDLSKIRTACPHFDQWLQTLEAFGSQ